jgi:hypothetical protein
MMMMTMMMTTTNQDVSKEHTTRYDTIRSSFKLNVPPSFAILSHSSSLPDLSKKCPSVPSMAPFASGKQASGRVIKQPHNVFSSSVPSSSTNVFSRSFHNFNNSGDGAVPIRPVICFVVVVLV